MSGLSRRKFLQLSGSFAVGFSLLDAPLYAKESGQAVSTDLPGSLSNAPTVDSWIEILEGGTVRVLTGKIEIGQGIRTAVAQMAAEELNMDIDRVEVVLADTGRTPNERYTSGSRSIESSALAVRYAAASAREQLLKLASARLGKPVESLRLLEGNILVEGDSQVLSVGELLQGRQLNHTIELPVKLKPREHYRYVGKPVKRDDLKKIVTGRDYYVQDMRLPNMRHARVIHPPAYGQKLVDLQKDGVPSSVEIYRNGSFLAVLGDSEWETVKGAELVRNRCRWSNPPTLPSRIDGEYLQSLPSEREVVSSSEGFQPFTPHHEAEYFRPYIMHGSVGPCCALAQFDGQQLTVWTHSQGVYPLRASMSGLVDLGESEIRVIGVPGAGCYGHNGADDVAAEVALLAKAFPGRPIRLQWSREDENRWEPFGSAQVVRLSARLSEAQKITHWRHELWSDTHSTRPGGDPGRLLPALYLAKPQKPSGRGFLGGASRNAPPYYEVGSTEVVANYFDAPLRVSALRSLGAQANIFALESFVDELAEKLGQDPFRFRLSHLKDPRAVEVLKRLKAITDRVKTPENEGFGIAFARYKNSQSYCAVGALVRKNGSDIKIKKLWGVVDAGEVINPDGLANQIEGGMVQSASWTLLERVTTNGRAVTSTDWDSYPILRTPEVPETEVVVIDRPQESPLGAGETAQGPTSAAIANAYRKAGGPRVRRLPFKRRGGD